MEKILKQSSLNTDCYNNETTVSDIISLMNMHVMCLLLYNYSSNYFMYPVVEHNVITVAYMLLSSKLPVGYLIILAI